MATSVYSTQLGWRTNHSSEIEGDDVIIWGGNQNGLPLLHDSAKKRSITTKLDVLNLPTMEWSNVSTTGTPPAGVMNYGMTTIGEEMYVFGGRCHSDSSECCHNDLYKLNTKNRVWRAIPTTDGPMKKYECGFTSYSYQGSDYLLALGGKRGKRPPLLPQQKAQYTPNEHGYYYTNEVHLMNVTTSPGEWTSPNITGDRPPPIADFTLNKLSTDGSKAVLFGGRIALKKNNSCFNDDMYILSLTNDTVSFTKHTLKNTFEYPESKIYHSSTIINSGSEDHQLIIGGLYSDYQIIPDCWILNMTTKKWTKIDLPEEVCGRYAHSVSSVTMNSNTQWIILTGGGGRNGVVVTGDNITMIVEMEYVHNKWLVQGTWNSTQRTQLLERMKKLRPATDTAGQTKLEEMAKEIQQLQKQLTEAHQEREEMAQTIQQKNNAITQKDDLIQTLQNTIALNEATIQTNEQTIIQQQTEITRFRDNPHWLIHQEEVQMTQQILGTGGWGQVTVGIFRGTRVAVKCLHQIIISDYNKQLFAREMDIASRIRHPNLLLFIGATKQPGNPLILTELMPTSLRKQLENSPMTRPQVIAIGMDVASALNYLHCWKPSPILHRDVSSANILLEPSGRALWKAKLSDYGSANLLDKIQTVSPGNPVYSAPEANNPSLHSPAMDIYSLGILLVEMATGQFPATESFERVAQIASINWQNVKQLMQSCTAQDPNVRPSTNNLLEQLKQL